jgi:hypothetical protein
VRINVKFVMLAIGLEARAFSMAVIGLAHAVKAEACNMTVAGLRM